MDGPKKCKRCKGDGIIVVDRGYHVIKCRDCHPDWIAFRAKQTPPAPTLLSVKGSDK